MNAFSCEDPRMPNWLLFWFVIIVMWLLILSGCSKPVEKLPPPPAKVIEAAVAIPVPCEIEQVPVADRPARTARKGDDIFTLSKIAAADRKVLEGENIELRAANTGGCE
jgi:hypothetical protein